MTSTTDGSRVRPDDYQFDHDAVGYDSLMFVDSHTGGEPTRVITGGFASLVGTSVAAQRDDLADRFGNQIGAIVAEPRGTEATVAALLVPAADPSCVTGVIYFDSQAILGMCGHGTIGVVETLRFLGRIDAGVHHLETPVGVIRVELQLDGSITIDNVTSQRLARDVGVDVDGIGEVRGDVAYGGNYFFLVRTPSFDLNRPRSELLAAADRIMTAAKAAGWNIDHVELFGDPTVAGANSRSFVLCPSGTYDRSPCGTGTSAKLACLAADGLLAPGEPWVQESITGSTFLTHYRVSNDVAVPNAIGRSEDPAILPTITGRAEVVATGRAVFIEGAEFCDRPTSEHESTRRASRQGRA